MSFSEVLRRIAARLEKCDVEYMVVGSIASTYYSAPRSTADFDFVVNATRSN